MPYCMSGNNEIKAVYFKLNSVDGLLTVCDIVCHRKFKPLYIRYSDELKITVHC